MHLNYEGKNVAVSGGGNVAMDTARTIKRLGAKNVYVIYRRAKEQMPAEELEIEEAEKEGVEFLFKTNIVKILGNEKVEKLECIKTELVEKEGEKRPVPVNIENSNYLLDMFIFVLLFILLANIFLSLLKHFFQNVQPMQQLTLFLLNLLLQIFLF